MLDIDTIEPARPFIEWLREVYPELTGFNAQIAQLIADALDVIDPDSAMARADAVLLARQFRYIAETLVGETEGDLEYPVEEEDEEEDDG